MPRRGWLGTWKSTFSGSVEGILNRKMDEAYDALNDAEEAMNSLNEDMLSVFHDEIIDNMSKYQSKLAEIRMMCGKMGLNGQHLESRFNVLKDKRLKKDAE